MDSNERKDFLELISRYGFAESEFELTENIICPPPGVVGSLSGTRTLRHKQSGITKEYQAYGRPPTWFSQLENDFASGFYKTRQ